MQKVGIQSVNIKVLHAVMVRMAEALQGWLWVIEAAAEERFYQRVVQPWAKANGK